MARLAILSVVFLTFGAMVAGGSLALWLGAGVGPSGMHYDPMIISGPPASPLRPPTP